MLLTVCLILRVLEERWLLAQVLVVAFQLIVDLVRDAQRVVEHLGRIHWQEVGIFMGVQIIARLLVPIRRTFPPAFSSALLLKSNDLLHTPLRKSSGAPLASIFHRAPNIFTFFKLFRFCPGSWLLTLWSIFV